MFGDVWFGEVRPGQVMYGKDFIMIETQGNIKRITKKGRYYEVDGTLYPSVTTILNYYPKFEPFWKWKYTNPDADIILKEAGEYGTNVHKAIEKTLNSGLDITEYVDLTEKEKKSVNLFGNWLTNLKKHKVEVVDIEKMVIGDGYGGTIDLVLKVDDTFWIIDIKTSKGLWITHELQLSAYKHALLNQNFLDLQKIAKPGYGIIDIPENYKLALLHINHNLDKYEFKEVEDNFDVFLAILKIFNFEQLRTTSNKRDKGP